MKTVLQYDEETDEFKPKLSDLQVYLLEKKPPTTPTGEEPQDGKKVKLQLTGREIDLGSAPFNLAKYARDPETTEKLYVNGNKDLYIEIAVQSKPMDDNSTLPPPNPARPPPQPRRHQTKNEPTSQEDFELVAEYKEREIEYRNQIAALKAEKDEQNRLNQEIQQEWQQLQMQGSDLEKVERKFAEIEFSKREKEKTIFQNYSHI